MTVSIFEITPLLLTYNEQENLERTLASLAWAHEIIVIDSGSTDRTLEILAKDPRIRVIHRTFDTFARQCNFGLSQISTRWALSMDADYVLSSELVNELHDLHLSCSVSGYRARFVYRIFGRPLRATLYPPRTVLYLVSKAEYRDEGHGHRVFLEGSIQDLRYPIFHDDRKPIDRWFRSQLAYAKREANHLLGSDPTELGRIDRLRCWGWVGPMIMPIYVLLFRGCILNGWSGLYYAFQRTFAELALAIEILDRRLRKRSLDRQ